MRRIALALAALAAFSVLPGAAVPSGAPPLCGQAGSGTATGTDHHVRVSSYNVLHGLEESASYPAHSTLDDRLELAADAMAASGVDVFGLEEVEDTVANAATQNAAGNVAQKLAAEVAERTSQTWYWCWYLANPHFPGEPDVLTGGGGPASNQIAALASDHYASFKEGEAVLSRYPIVASAARRLPGRLPAEAAYCNPLDLTTGNLNCPGTVAVESRIALWARVQTPGGDTDITVTHLSHDVSPLSDASTLEQAAAALAFSEEMSAVGTPSQRFFVCDCNSTPVDDFPVVPTIEAAGWTDAWVDANPSDPGYTSDQDIIAASDTTDARIDYVFVRDGVCDADILAAGKVGDAGSPGFGTATGFLWPSDHHGVTADTAADCDGY